uniref:Uncharacterized protein n=1 Tax=Fagus sylvatica TaxID=28930 RepID=A0A2N9HAW0_FAGSY
MAGEIGDKAKKNQKRDMRERQVAEPPKIIGVISVCSESTIVLFYHPISLQWTENHHGQVHQSVQGGSEFITEIQPTATDNIFAHYGRLNKEKKERKHTGAHVVRSNLSSAWASCNLFGLQALIRSLIQLVALLGTSIGGRRPPRPRHGSSRLPEAKKTRQVHISVQKGKKLTKAPIMHLGCVTHLFGVDMGFLGLHIDSMGPVRPRSDPARLLQAISTSVWYSTTHFSSFKPSRHRSAHPRSVTAPPSPICPPRLRQTAPRSDLLLLRARSASSRPDLLHLGLICSISD